MLGSNPVREVRETVNVYAQSALIGQQGEPTPKTARTLAGRSASYSLDYNSTSDLLLRGPLGAVRGRDEFTQTDAGAIMRLLPFHRSIGVWRLLEEMVSQFPEE